MFNKGGLETIIVTIVLIAIVVGLIISSVIGVSNSGEQAIQSGVNHLSSGMVTMDENY